MAEIMSHAIVLRETGGPEKLRYEPVRVPDPGPGELLIRTDSTRAVRASMAIQDAPPAYFHCRRRGWHRESSR